jgi:transcriptional antiterminator Rof (Rho-off)
VPGDWLDMRLTKLVHDEVYLSADEAVARDRLRRSEIEAAAVVLDEEGRVLRMDERLQFNTAGLRFLVVPHDEYARLYHLV